MLEHARAFDLDPSDRRPIHQLMEMFAEMGKWLGAIAALELAKQGSPPPEVSVALDLAMIELVGIVADRYPAANTDREADATIGRLVSNATARGVKLQLVVARSLIDIERVDEAKQLVATIGGAGELTAQDRGNLHYVEGLIAERERDAQRALERYERALAADPARVDAAVNATSLLLEEGTPEAFARIGTLVTEVAPLARAGSPELLFNEAFYHLRDERPAEGRVRLEQVLALTGGAGHLAELARGALAELG